MMVLGEEDHHHHNNNNNNNIWPSDPISVDGLTEQVPDGKF